VLDLAAFTFFVFSLLSNPGQMAGRVAIAVLLFSIATCSVAQMWPFKDHEYSKWDNAGAALFPSDFVTWPMRGNGKEAPGLHYGSVFLPGSQLTLNMIFP
jgi:hypothetical protein